MPSSNSIIRDIISKRLSKRRLFYVCRDIERASGIDLSMNNYYIITNHSELSAKLALQYPHIILIKEKEQLDTVNLLTHKQTMVAINKKDYVLVFKNNTLIEKVCGKNDWKLLNPDSKLADKIESKISQIEWLGKLAKYLPSYQINICKNIKWNKKPFILQFNHSHTGSGTFFIDSEKKLNNLKLKFSKRDVRVLKFIKGPVFTNNNIVWGNKVLIGNISYQITGISPFTDNKFATIGNDWLLPNKILNTNQIKQYKKIAGEIGKKLIKDGWKGLYGVDVIVDDKTKRLYLLEINARQPASTTCESQLQQKSEIRNPKSEFTTFEAHIAGLLDLLNKKYKLIPIHNGAQIVQRVGGQNRELEAPKDSSLINTIKYKNKLPGSDLIRFQFNKGIMKRHNVLNRL